MMVSPTAANPSSTHRWGYMVGGGLLALSLVMALVSFLDVVMTSARGLHKFSVPGVEILNIKKPGVYVGVAAPEKAQAASLQDLSRLQFSLTDTATQAQVSLMGFPAARTISVAGRAGAPLFQTEIESAGEYMLMSAYPDEGPGPTVEAYLVHESMNETRAGLVIGLLLFLVFAGAGVTVLVKTYRGAKALKAPVPAPKKK